MPGSFLRSESEQRVDALLIEADNDVLAVDNRRRGSHRAEIDQIVHGCFIGRDVAFGELNALTRQILCLYVAGASAGLSIEDDGVLALMALLALICDHAQTLLHITTSPASPPPKLALRLIGTLARSVPEVGKGRYDRLRNQTEASRKELDGMTVLSGRCEGWPGVR